MKKKVTVFFVSAIMFLSGYSVNAQLPSRSYTASNFALVIGSSKGGYLKPIMKGDTLVYTVKSISDTLVVRKKCDSLFNKYGKRYYLRYKIKKP